MKKLDVAKLLAEFLDRQFVIPGTSIRIGLDPVIGLIPGIGDLLSSAAGSVILFVAAHYHLPKIVLFRMGMNIAINGLLGAIPIIGDLFSVWFKSNVRNMTLLENHLHQPQQNSTFGDWAFVVTIFLSILLLLIGMIAAITWLIKKVWDAVGTPS